MARSRRWMTEKVTRVGDDEEEEASLSDVELNHDFKWRQKKLSNRERWVTRSRMALICILLVVVLITALGHADEYKLLSQNENSSCDSVQVGYTCAAKFSHLWGQYSPYFQVPPTTNLEVPAKCKVTFAQILSRHGARDPTHHKTILYAQTINKIRAQVPPSEFKGAFAFLVNHNYSLGSDHLTDFGRKELFNQGVQFFQQYSDLANDGTPFIRASGQERVIESAQKFGAGFHHAKTTSKGAGSVDKKYPYDIITISEDAGSNNTLNHGLCPAFKLSKSKTGPVAQATFAKTFLPSIQSRLQAALPHANLTFEDTIVLMDLCPFETVASKTGQPSPFCSLFTVEEWSHYDYYQTLGKYYGSGAGAPLGSTQGVGFVNELISRLTRTPVQDHTTVNHTLDKDPATFPLDRALYADFSHDNLMISVYAALGLYNNTPVLDTRRLMSLEDLKGFSSATTVPFAGRAVIEKMTCSGKQMVRVNMNGRVLPLEMCGGDANGRCDLDAFVGALKFAREGGRWDECFLHDGDDESEGRDKIPSIIPSS